VACSYCGSLQVSCSGYGFRGAPCHVCLCLCSVTRWVSVCGGAERRPALSPLASFMLTVSGCCNGMPPTAVDGGPCGSTEHCLGVVVRFTLTPRLSSAVTLPTWLMFRSCVACASVVSPSCSRGAGCSGWGWQLGRPGRVLLTADAPLVVTAGVVLAGDGAVLIEAAASSQGGRLTATPLARSECSRAL
jgi:hypothetical protein